MHFFLISRVPRVFIDCIFLFLPSRPHQCSSCDGSRHYAARNIWHSHRYYFVHVSSTLALKFRYVVKLFRLKWPWFRVFSNLTCELPCAPFS
jgi:hypothetical protein